MKCYVFGHDSLFWIWCTARALLKASGEPSALVASHWKTSSSREASARWLLWQRQPSSDPAPSATSSGTCLALQGSTVSSKGWNRSKFFLIQNLSRLPGGKEPLGLSLRFSPSCGWLRLWTRFLGCLQNCYSLICKFGIFSCGIFEGPA